VRQVPREEDNAACGNLIAAFSGPEHALSFEKDEHLVLGGVDVHGGRRPGRQVRAKDRELTEVAAPSNSTLITPPPIHSRC
jgi:hypothetical protein